MAKARDMCLVEFQEVYISLFPSLPPVRLSSCSLFEVMKTSKRCSSICLLFKVFLKSEPLVSSMVLLYKSCQQCFYTSKCPRCIFVSGTRSKEPKEQWLMGFYIVDNTETSPRTAALCRIIHPVTTFSNLATIFQYRCGSVLI